MQFSFTLFGQTIATTPHYSNFQHSHIGSTSHVGTYIMQYACVHCVHTYIINMYLICIMQDALHFTQCQYVGILPVHKEIISWWRIFCQCHHAQFKAKTISNFLISKEFFLSFYTPPWLSNSLDLLLFQCDFSRLHFGTKYGDEES